MAANDTKNLSFYDKLRSSRNMKCEDKPERNKNRERRMSSQCIEENEEIVSLVEENEEY